MINCGIGETQANSLLATLNIPGICSKSLKKREREVDVVLRSIAEQSCQRTLQEEATLYVTTTRLTIYCAS